MNVAIDNPPHTLDGLSIVLPCFGEAENLPAAIRYATEAAERCAATHEIIVVDDGSSDDTVAVAGRLAAQDARVRLVVHAANRGYGQALRSGIAAARMEWVLLIDADLQFVFAELEGLPVALAVGRPRRRVADPAAGPGRPARRRRAVESLRPRRAAPGGARRRLCVPARPA